MNCRVTAGSKYHNGYPLHWGSAFKRRARETPSITGIATSATSRSGHCASIAVNPLLPLEAKYDGMIAALQYQSKHPPEDDVVIDEEDVSPHRCFQELNGDRQRSSLTRSRKADCRTHPEEVPECFRGESRRSGNAADDPRACGGRSEP
jgi:hypothetical protein